MTERCTNCGAVSLESTFRRNAGLCKPCWKDQRKRTIGETPFGIAYERYFHRPPGLTKYFDCWMQLELAIAGPLFAARERGDVSYVFKRSVIVGVEDFRGLITWMNDQIGRFRERVRDMEPSTYTEAKSRDALLNRAADLEALIALWPEFEKDFGRGTA
jgi:hypothetical protein